LNQRRAPKRRSSTAKNVFVITAAIATLMFLGVLILQPPATLGECDPATNMRCSCPTDPDAVKHKNILLVDTTDPLRAGKVSDVEQLLKTFSSRQKDLIEWLQDGKRVDETSVFLLTNVAPPDMKPVAIVCTQPPRLSTLISGTGKEIRESQARQTNTVRAAMERLESGQSSGESPLLEALAILTSNATAWRPGGTIIIASDFLQNTSSCGYFERMTSIPPVSSLSSQCQGDVRKIGENIRKTTTYTDSTVVAFCEMPGKPRKTGLQAFWLEVFQEPLGYDVIRTCDSQEILNRRLNLMQ